LNKKRQQTANRKGSSGGLAKDPVWGGGGVARMLLEGGGEIARMKKKRKEGKSHHGAELS